MNAIYRNATAVAVCLLLGACAATPNPALEEARAAYAAIRDNPAAAQGAPVALRKAEQSIERATAALDSGNEKAAEHYAYLAQRRVEIAAAQGERVRLQQQIAEASERRDELRLRAERANTLSAKARAAAARTRAAELEARLRQMEAEKTDRGMVLTLGDVLFDTDKATLRPGAQQVVGELAAFMRDYPKREILIEGHTDSRGTESYNLTLSKRRAQAVNRALIARGIGRRRIATVGLGEQYPVASNATAAGRQQNRRVEIVISDPQGNVERRG